MPPIGSQRCADGARPATGYHHEPGYGPGHGPDAVPRCGPGHAAGRAEAPARGQWRRRALSSLSLTLGAMTVMTIPGSAPAAVSVGATVRPHPADPGGDAPRVVVTTDPATGRRMRAVAAPRGEPGRAWLPRASRARLEREGRRRRPVVRGAARRRGIAHGGVGAVIVDEAAPPGP
jgi:hypothetical protein